MLDTKTGNWSLIPTVEYSIPHALGVDFVTKGKQKSIASDNIPRNLLL
jgi:hypothetical protein